MWGQCMQSEQCSMILQHKHYYAASSNIWNSWWQHLKLGRLMTKLISSREDICKQVSYSHCYTVKPLKNILNHHRPLSWKSVLIITRCSVMIFHLMEPLEVDPDGWAWKMLIWSLYTWYSNIWAKVKWDFEWALVVQFKSDLAAIFESWMTCCFIYLLLDTKMWSQSLFH